VLPDHELFDAALAYAHRLSEQAPLAVEQIKRRPTSPTSTRASRPRRRPSPPRSRPPDAREGISAFLEKRTATFQGR
jgi:enoyl-CoA hydratase/3-hydroxyacyl-CoA dehydrogenase